MIQLRAAEAIQIRQIRIRTNTTERILADKIYQNRNNLAYCREHRIRLSGPSLGRPKKDAGTDKKVEYKDNADRIAVERAFALAKQKYGIGLATSRLDETTRSSIVLSVIAMYVDRICRSRLRLFYDIVFQSTDSMNSC